MWAVLIPMKSLLIAAGGGGDAITATLVHAALHGADAPALVLTYAWERLVVDPVPGPRGRADFTGTVPAGDQLRLITPRSAPRPPAGSSLPRLAADLRPELGLLDPYEGTPGLAAQIGEAVTHCGADRIVVVDVGGDVITDGTEPTLRSPLADALVLAACARLGTPAEVYVAGPGLDNEVPAELLLPRLGAPAFALEAADTEPVGAVFDWHPSEASALLVAAARGVRGVCGTRDSERPITLTSDAAHVHRLTLEDALRLNPLARALADAADLAEAEEASRQVCGFSEIERERRRALALREENADGTGAATAARAEGAPEGRRAPEGLWDRFLDWERTTFRLGLSHVTSRRIREELRLGLDAFQRLRAQLMTASPVRDAAPLWRLHGG